MNKKKNLHPFAKSQDRLRRPLNGQSTTPTSPEHATTSPESPIKSLYTQLNGASQPESIAVPPRRKQRHRRTASNSPRISPRNSASPFRTSPIRVDSETQTEDNVDSAPHTPYVLGRTFLDAATCNRPVRHATLKEIRSEDSLDDKPYNGNGIVITYSENTGETPMYVTHLGTTHYICDRAYLNEPDSNSNDKIATRECSDDDQIEMLGRKVTAILNGNRLSDELSRVVDSKSDNGNNQTENQPENESWSDEEGEVVVDFNYSLRRKR